MKMSLLTNVHYVFILLIAIRIENIASIKILNVIWPYIDSIQFPYPTKDPINITSYQTRPVLTSPLRFITKPSDQSTIENTGSTLLVISHEPQLANLTSGVLFGDIYHFFQTEFFWDNSLSRSPYNYIDGTGAPLTAVSSYFNSKYGNYNNAKIKRDGIAQTVFYVNVLGTVDNRAFDPFESIVQEILKAGSLKKLPEELGFDWFYRPSLHYYYAYPGEFLDHSTGKIYYSSTVMLILLVPRPSISVRQFEATFARLKNKAGKPYSHILKTFPRGPRPVVVAAGVTLKP